MFMPLWQQLPQGLFCCRHHHYAEHSRYWVGERCCNVWASGRRDPNHLVAPGVSQCTSLCCRIFYIPSSNCEEVFLPRRGLVWRAPWSILNNNDKELKY